MADDSKWNWIAECEKRLEQMASLSRGFTACSGATITSTSAGRPPRLERPSFARSRRLYAEIELMTESFYYVGFRFHVMKTTLGINYFPIGIRDVRNWLIEHAQKIDASAQTCGRGVQ